MSTFLHAVSIAAGIIVGLALALMVISAIFAGVGACAVWLGARRRRSNWY
jgi:hypothetical protein